MKDGVGFDSLNGLEKMKATSAMLSNVAKFNELKEIVEDEVGDLKDDLRMVYKYAKVYAEELPKMKEKAKEVASKCKKCLPVEAYAAAFGPIWYSKKARKKWEKYMKKKYWWYRRSYNPKNYPLTHQKDH